MTLRVSTKILVASALLVATAESQSLKPYKLMEPPTDTWPMYNGDYSGRRFSTLNRINDSNISSLSLAWVYRVNVSGGGAQFEKKAACSTYAPIMRGVLLRLNGRISGDKSADRPIRAQ